MLLEPAVSKVVPIFCTQSSSALTDSLKLFPSNTVLYRIMAMKKNKYYHKSSRFCSEAMGRSSSKSQRRSLQHLIYPPVKIGNKLIAKIGRFRHHLVKFFQVRISRDGDFSSCRQNVPSSLGPTGISHIVT